MPTMLVYFDNRWCTRAIKFECSLYISMGQYKRDVTPGVTHWRYVFLALNHRYGLFSLNWYHCILIVSDLAICHQPCTVYWMSAQWSEYQQSCYTDHENGHISPHQHPWQHFWWCFRWNEPKQTFPHPLLGKVNTLHKQESCLCWLSWFKTYPDHTVTKVWKLMVIKSIPYLHFGWPLLCRQRLTIDKVNLWPFN